MVKLFYIHYSIDSVQHKNFINSRVTSIAWHGSYLSNNVFVVISIYCVQLKYKAIDRLIHLQYVQSVLPVWQNILNNTIIALVLYTHVIGRLTNGITVMCLTHGFMVGLGNNGFTNPIISSCLEISSAYNPFFSRFSSPVATHRCNVCRVNGLHNIPHLLPPGDHTRVQNS